MYFEIFHIIHCLRLPQQLEMQRQVDFSSSK